MRLLRSRIFATLVLVMAGLSPESLFANTDLTLISTAPTDQGGTSYSVSLQALLFMTLLSVLPAGLIAMTSFTRIIVVLAILRQALGIGQTPSNQILLGLALFLTIFIMAPVFERVYLDAAKPYMEDQIDLEEGLSIGAQSIRGFMLEQTREQDLVMFSEMGGYEPFESTEDIPLHVLSPSFLISELKTAFQIGFLVFIPFLIIDLIVASVLMSMGMMMLSPVIISLPFKIMLFVLIDGWSLIVGTLVSSFVR